MDTITKKIQNPMEVLRKLQQFRQSSDHAPSTCSPAEISPTLVASLRDLKAHLSVGDFLENCAENPDTARGALKMLSLLSLAEVPASVARFVIEFEALFTQFHEIFLRPSRNDLSGHNFVSRWTLNGITV